MRIFTGDFEKRTVGFECMYCYFALIFLDVCMRFVGLLMVSFMGGFLSTLFNFAKYAIN